MAADAFTQAHDAVADALRQVDAAWRLREENPSLLRPALDHFHSASTRFARLIEQQEHETDGEG